MKEKTCLLSVVIPVWNESASIEAFFRRLFPVVEGLGVPWEVIAIDDGSTDDTLARLRAWCEGRPNLQVLALARNFGQHAAVMAGFAASRGSWVITLDADLQNPPEEIPRILHHLREGHDLVNTYRLRRKDSALRRLASSTVNALTRKLSGIHLRDFGCMLRGYDRRILRSIIARKEVHTFIPALATLYARNPVEVPVAHSVRAHGSSKYSLWKLFTLNLDLMTSFSLAPLRGLFSVGAVAAALGGGLGLLLILLRVIYGAGWAAEGVFTLFAVLFVFVGAQFLAFGLLGEYIGRIHLEVRKRPPYVLLGEPSDEEEDRPPRPPAAGKEQPQARSPREAAEARP